MQTVARNCSDGSVQELKSISDAMTQALQTENEAVMQIAVDRINRNPTLVSRLFPNLFEKEEQRITLDRMRTMYEKRKEYFEFCAAIRLAIARKEADALIASVGTGLQHKLAAFATEKIDEMSGTIGQSRRRFLERIKPQMVELENYKDVPELYEMARLSIHNEMRTYFTGIDELLSGFIAALKSRVSM